MNKFEVGDRVAVYVSDPQECSYGPLPDEPARLIGIIKKVNSPLFGSAKKDNRYLMVDVESGERFFWPQQCRRLVKRKRDE